MSDAVLLVGLMQKYGLMILLIQIGRIGYVNEVYNNHLFISIHWEINRIGLHKTNQYKREWFKSSAISST